jgi:predicted DNA-binding transcriptional regulator YafY
VNEDTKTPQSIYETADTADGLRASQLALANELLREAVAVGLYATVVQPDGTKIMVRDRIAAYLESLPRWEA